MATGADISYEAKFSADIADLKKGILEIQNAVGEIGKKTKEMDSKTKGFLNNFSQGFKRLGLDANKAGADIGKTLGHMIGPMSLAMTALNLVITKAKKAWEDYKKSLEESKKASADLTYINETLGFSLEINEKKLRNLSEAQKEYIGTMKSFADKQETLNIQIEKGFITETDGRKQQIELTKQEEIATEKNILRLKEEIAAIESQLAAETMLVEGSEVHTQKYDKLIQQQQDLNKAISNERVQLVSIQELRAETQKKLSESGTEAAKVFELEKKEKTEQQKADEAYLTALEKQKDAEKAAHDANAAGLLTEREMYGEILAANEALYNDLENINNQYSVQVNGLQDVQDRTAGIVRNERDRLKALDEQKTLADVQKTIDEERNKLNAANAEIAFALASGMMTEKEAEEATKKAAEDFNAAMAKAAGEFSSVNGAAELLKDNIEDVDKDVKKIDWDKMSGEFSKVTDAFSTFGNSILEITSGIADDQIAIIQEKMEAQQELIDAQYEATMERLDAERNAALEAAGFIAATSAEGLEASMQAAIDSGDEGVIYAEKRRQEELAINKKFDAAEKAALAKKNADEKALQEKAKAEQEQIQYEVAIGQWAMQLAQLPSQIVATIAQAASQFGPIAGPIIGGALGVAMTASMIASMPKKPSGASGGSASVPQIAAPSAAAAQDASFSASPMETRAAVSESPSGGSGMSGAGMASQAAETALVPFVFNFDGVPFANGVIDLINRGQTVNLSPA